MGYYRITLTPAEYQVFMMAIVRFEKQTSDAKTNAYQLANSICKDIIAAIKEKEREVLAEDTEE